MTQVEERYLSQGVDYFGFLNAELRGLKGFTALAHELIQNADDAEASWISFDICDDALLVENGALFSDCNSSTDKVCPWRNDPEKNHACDLHRFRIIAGGDKRRQNDTIGAFGIGFISVYQITDRPEMFCGQRHWIIRPEQNEDKRILEKSVEELPHTKFRLPWATDPDSAVRKALDAQPVMPEMKPEILRELGQVLPRAITFLRHIREIRLLDNHAPVKTIYLSRKESGIEIRDGEQLTLWEVIRGNFKAEAERLKQSSGIQHKRKPEVEIAVRMDDAEMEGVLFAILPTQQSLGMAMHLNADFFPSSDRQRILFVEDYQGRWNKAAIEAGARALAKALPDLATKLSHISFWKLIQQIKNIHSTTLGKFSIVFDVFWEQVDPVIKQAPVVFSSREALVRANEVLLLMKYDDESEAVPIFERLGMSIVHSDLRQYYSLLQKIGVKVLSALDLSKGLQKAGLCKIQQPEGESGWILSGNNHELLSREIGRLLARLNGDKLQTAREALATCSIALSASGILTPPRKLFEIDFEVFEIFSQLGKSERFISVKNPDEIVSLVPHLTIENSIDLLEEVPPESYERVWTTNPQCIVRLVKWLVTQKITSEVLKKRVRALLIWPSCGKLYSLESLVVPGDFKDPLQISSIVDLEGLEIDAEFLIEMGARKLTLNNYASEEVKRAFASGATVSESNRCRLVQLFSKKFGDLADDENAQRALNACPLVECTDGSFRLAREVYFQNEELREVLGRDVQVVKLPANNTQAVRTFLEWLGVSDKPRLETMIERVQILTQNPPTGETLNSVQRIFIHIAQRDNIDSERSAVLKRLSNIAWLPAHGDKSQWYKPEDVYAVYQQYLFSSQARFLNVNHQDKCADFIKEIGVKTVPEPRLVVAHLLEMAKTKQNVNKEVYTFLNRCTSDPAIARLRGNECILLDNDRYLRPDQVFWEDPEFGRYRFRLGPEMRAYHNLFTDIGVRERPSKADAIAVILEISEVFGLQNRPLDDETKLVVMHCWRLLNKSQETELKEIKRRKTVPDNRSIMELPNHIFFDDRPGLVDRFGEFLRHNVISRPQDAWRGMLAAGVRLLSEAVQTQLIAKDNPVENSDLSDRVLSRRKIIDRVIETHRQDSGARWDLDKLRELRFVSVSQLLITHEISALTNFRTTIPAVVTAFYDQDDEIIYYQRQDDGYPWSAIARELAYALNPRAEAGKIAPGLKEALSADSLVEASHNLDELGYASLDVPDAEPIPSETVGLGASEAAITSCPEAELPDGSNEVEFEIPAIDSPNSAHPEVPLRKPTSTFTTNETGGSNGTSKHPGLRMGQRDGISDTSDDSLLQPNVPTTQASLSRGVQPVGTQRPVRRPLRSRLLSYVAPPDEEARESTPNKEVAERRTMVDDLGIEKVMMYEKGQGRDPHVMPHNNEGFDIKSFDRDGKLLRYIEVKSLSGDWGLQDPILSVTQFIEHAMDKGERYWLYVVERSEQEDYRIHRIQNPAQSVTGYAFDKGWIALRESDEPATENET